MAWGSAQEAASLYSLLSSFPDSQLGEVGLCWLDHQDLPPDWGFSRQNLPFLGASPDGLLRHPPTRLTPLPTQPGSQNAQPGPAPSAGSGHQVPNNTSTETPAARGGAADDTMPHGSSSSHQNQQRMASTSASFTRPTEGVYSSQNGQHFAGLPVGQQPDAGPMSISSAQQLSMLQMGHQQHTGRQYIAQHMQTHQAAAAAVPPTSMPSVQDIERQLRQKLPPHVPATFTPPHQQQGPFESSAPHSRNASAGPAAGTQTPQQYAIAGSAMPLPNHVSAGPAALLQTGFAGKSNASQTRHASSGTAASSASAQIRPHVAPRGVGVTAIGKGTGQTNVQSHAPPSQGSEAIIDLLRLLQSGAEGTPSADQISHPAASAGPSEPGSASFVSSPAAALKFGTVPPAVKGVSNTGLPGSRPSQDPRGVAQQNIPAGSSSGQKRGLSALGRGPPLKQPRPIERCAHLLLAGICWMPKQVLLSPTV